YICDDAARDIVYCVRRQRQLCVIASEATVRSRGAIRDHDAATHCGRAPSGATSISRATHRAIGALPNA
ncbi:hypothetical protein D8O30_18455, partial [Burkholderia mallei]